MPRVHRFRLDGQRKRGHSSWDVGRSKATEDSESSNLAWAVAVQAAHPTESALLGRTPPRPDNARPHGSPRRRRDSHPSPDQSTAKPALRLGR